MLFAAYEAFDIWLTVESKDIFVSCFLNKFNNTFIVGRRIMSRCGSG